MATTPAEPVAVEIPDWMTVERSYEPDPARCRAAIVRLLEWEPNRPAEATATPGDRPAENGVSDGSQGAASDRAEMSMQARDTAGRAPSRATLKRTGARPLKA